MGMSNLITFSMNKSYQDKLDKIAKHEDLNKSDLLRRLIDKKFKEINKDL